MGETDRSASGVTGAIGIYDYWRNARFDELGNASRFSVALRASVPGLARRVVASRAQRGFRYTVVRSALRGGRPREPEKRGTLPVGMQMP